MLSYKPRGENSDVRWMVAVVLPGIQRVKKLRPHAEGVKLGYERVS